MVETQVWVARTGKGQGRSGKGVYSGNTLKSASKRDELMKQDDHLALGKSREMAERKRFKMKKLSSALYMLHLGKKRTIQVVISTKG